MLTSIDMFHTVLDIALYNTNYKWLLIKRVSKDKQAQTKIIAINSLSFEVQFSKVWTCVKELLSFI